MIRIGPFSKVYIYTPEVIRLGRNNAELRSLPKSTQALNPEDVAHVITVRFPLLITVYTQKLKKDLF